ncbi:MAG TPA: type II secretion system protein [Candidatus Chromulinivoraceae bacterium]|nr:type II secretion system protein [Candidatus Chromulinivoraceae bacterium]
MNAQQQKQKGFTIIEVVLVLAIAALIFLMVFIALPALQRSQRDTQRKQDLSRAITAVTNYQSNNRGGLPSDWVGFATSYLRSNGDSFTDPAGTDYKFVPGPIASGASFDASNPSIYENVGASCNGESLTTNAGAHKVALQMKLEGGGIACDNN